MVRCFPLVNMNSLQGISADLPFERWMTWLFDRPVLESPWSRPAEDYNVPPTTAVTYLTRLFENCKELLRPYSDAQVNQGLWLLSDSGDDYTPALREASVPWPDRRRAVRSIRNLFADCFATRCSPHLSHLDESGTNPLNSICYMWWDLFPSGPLDDPPLATFDSELIGIMDDTLHLASDACRESSLHGLGHWQTADPDRVEQIIRRFLESHPEIRPELRQYAERARTGDVR